MMVSVGIMVGSFRETVKLWLDSQLRADIYVAPPVPLRAGIYPPIAATFPGSPRKTPGVADIDVFYAFEFHYGHRARHTSEAGQHGHRPPPSSPAFSLRGRQSDAILESLPDHDRAIVTEPFANKHHVHAGDILRSRLGAAVSRSPSPEFTTTIPATAASSSWTAPRSCKYLPRPAGHQHRRLREPRHPTPASGPPPNLEVRTALAALPRHDRPQRMFRAAALVEYSTARSPSLRPSKPSPSSSPCWARRTRC